MDLAALMTVTVASKREEKVSDAPGIITVITANEIHKYGARHLGDVINRLTNTQLIGSNVFPQNVNSIRGPGSVLYGTNAYSGVLNIVTKNSATFNGGTINFHGIELEGKAQITESWSFMGSASWQENSKKNGADNSTFTPNIMIKTGMSYKSDDGYILSIFNSYFGKPTPVSDINPAVVERNKDADSYNLLTVNINIDVNKLIDWQNGPNIEFSLYGDNLLNEDIFFPDINRQPSNTLPHHEGRGIYATLKVNY